MGYISKLWKSGFDGKFIVGCGAFTVVMFPVAVLLIAVALFSPGIITNRFVVKSLSSDVTVPQTLPTAQQETVAISTPAFEVETVVTPNGDIDIKDTPIAATTPEVERHKDQVTATSAGIYELEWKIKEGRPIAYKTAMEVLENNTSVDYDRVFNFSQGDNGGEMGSQFEEMFEDLQNIQPTYSFVSILEKKPDGNISAKMILDNVEMPENNSVGQDFGQLWQGMEGSVQLQGEITPEGAIASSYIAQRQKNLLALFFELPVNPVQIGDSWQIDLTCIMLNSAQFTIEDSDKVNQVTLKDVVETSDGSLVAILDYTIIESVKGEQSTFFNNEAAPTTMKCSFLGRGEFLIEQGRWKTLSIENRIQSTGMITSDVAQRLGLSFLDEVPELPEPKLPSMLEQSPEPQELSMCWYTSQEVIGENSDGFLSINSYVPSDGWESSTGVLLQLANIDPPAEVEVDGEKFVRNPFEKMAGEQPTLPLDSYQSSEPVISLMLSSGEKNAKDMVILRFDDKEYNLVLGTEMNEYCLR